MSDIHRAEILEHECEGTRDGLMWLDEDRHELPCCESGADRSSWCLYCHAYELLQDRDHLKELIREVMDEDKNSVGDEGLPADLFQRLFESQVASSSETSTGGRLGGELSDRLP